MSRRGRPKHIYEVRYTQPPELLPSDEFRAPWSDDFALRASGDLEWAAKAMCYSPSYLRVLLSANRGAELTNDVVFRNCRVVARMRRLA